MSHIVSVMGATEARERVEWFCRCGAGRVAADIGQAGAEACSHLRAVEEGLEWS